MQSYQRFQHVGHTAFNTSDANGPRSLSHSKAGTHSAFGEGSYTRAHTAKQGLFRMGVVSLPSERSARFGNPAWPGVRTANFAAFGSCSEALSKNADSLRNSDAHDARRCSAGVAAPLGCVIFLQFGDVALLWLSRRCLLYGVYCFRICRILRLLMTLHTFLRYF